MMDRMLGNARALAVLGALLLGVGCPESSSQGEGDAKPDVIEPGDLPTTDLDGDGGDADAADAEVADADADTGAADADTKDASTLPDDFGKDCNEAGDCSSGWCVPSADGTVCTATCTQECPPGWDCSEVQQAGSDPTFICTDPSALLCHPCDENADCNLGGTKIRNRCISQGAAGSFCGLACNPNGSGCPPGYACEAFPGATGDIAPFQCVVETGECACNTYARSLGSSTSCAVENELGSCGGTRACGPGGLGTCDAPAPVAESCNAVDDDCDGETDEELSGAACQISNEFGSCEGVLTCTEGSATCDGPDPAAELCDGIDNDCNGFTDDDFPNTDLDEFADCVDPDDDNDGYDDEEDCAPLDAAVNPGATESCNGLDDDCDTLTDEEDAEGCVLYWRDVDDDTWGAVGVDPKCLCDPDEATFFSADKGGDCNDLVNTINPAAPEACNGKDDNCNGQTDEGTDVDTDEDGVFDCVDPDDDNDGYDDIDDCAPLDATINPGATEACNGKDDNCNGIKDEEGAQGCLNFWRDTDKDDQGAANESPRCLCGPDAESLHTSDNANDCNDLDAAIFLGATELCNGKDDDCDGETDEGTGVDTDGDGEPDCIDTDDDNDTWPDNEDCAPLDDTIFPGAPEICNGKDDNCNGLKDEAGAQGCSNFWQDADNDTFGSQSKPPQCLCGPDPVGGFTALNGLDCLDSSNTVSPDGTEVCNGLDDNCDGSTDEGVSSPCGDCSPTCLLEVGKDKPKPYELNDETSDGVKPTPDGAITLSSSLFEFPFAWISNSAEDTVTKLDTDTGCEAARYSVCDNPSRTAVDLDGNGIISCRGDGRVAKVAILAPDCIDKNGNGVIETSMDTNGDCKITPKEMVKDDECVLWVVQPDGPNSTECINSGVGLGCARAAGVDADNNVWIGFWNSSRIAKLDGKTGDEIVSFPTSGRPYGLAVDAFGTVWVASRSPSPQRIMKIDPMEGEVAFYAHPSGPVYGLALDHEGNVWVAGGEQRTVGRFDPIDETWTVFSDLAPGIARGVAVRIVRNEQDEVVQSDVFIAHHSWTTGCTADGTHRSVSVVDALKLQKKPIIDLGSNRAPVGCAIDRLGFLWTVNQCESSATKIDTTTGQVLGSYPVGLAPYTYSDMTGYALKTITTKNGFYRQIFEGWTGSQTRWAQILVEGSLPPGDGTTWVQVEYRSADSILGLGSKPFIGTDEKYPPNNFPLNIELFGRYLEVKVTLGTDDGKYTPTVNAISVVAFEVK